MTTNDKEGSRNYVERITGTQNINSVLQHFLREVRGQSAKCKLCRKILKTMYVANGRMWNVAKRSELRENSGENDEHPKTKIKKMKVCSGPERR
ncbi:hypothetical protein J437_LFUL009743 [Ladona fulva]|uniref:Uncharacterized protein n=1 Tax=Ladona fulva TaxID=123851 RepID=A0A8K0P0I3_LADFU|nr:hypothetical protein J437_LFUL009743 [Ladona fulva]